MLKMLFYVNMLLVLDLAFVRNLLTFIFSYDLTYCINFSFSFAFYINLVINN